MSSPTLGPGGQQRGFGPGGTEQPRPHLDFTTSNLILMVGGQILILAIVLMIVLFGVPQVSFPANAVRKMLNSTKTT